MLKKLTFCFVQIVSVCCSSILQPLKLDQFLQSNNSEFYIHGSMHRESNLITVQQDVTVFSLLYFCRQLYMFRVLTLLTTVRAPDDGCQHLKHVELPTEI